MSRLILAIATFAVAGTLLVGVTYAEVVKQQVAPAQTNAPSLKEPSAKPAKKPSAKLVLPIKHFVGY